MNSELLQTTTEIDGYEFVGKTPNGARIVIDRFAEDVSDLSGEEEILQRQTEILKLEPEKRHEAYLALYPDNRVFKSFSENEASFRALEQCYTRNKIRFNGAVGVDDGGASNRWFECFKNARAVRERLTTTTNILVKSIYEKFNADPNQAVEISSIASGSARAVVEALQKRPAGSLLRSRMLDWDDEARDYSKSLAREHGVEGCMESMKGDLLRARKYLGKGSSDIVEAVGILDYLDDKVFVFLLEQIKGILKEDGVGVFSNIMDNPEKEFLHTAMKWRPMYYRTEDAFARLIEQAGFSPEKTTLHRIPLGLYTVAEVRK